MTVRLILIHDWLRLRAARSWPSAEATISAPELARSSLHKPEETPSSLLTVGISSHVLGNGFSCTHGVGNFKWFVRVAYSFNVGGEYHGGFRTAWSQANKPATNTRGSSRERTSRFRINLEIRRSR